MERNMYADIIVKSEAVFDSVADEPFKGSIGIKGNRIVAVSKGGDLAELKSEKTRVVDCGKRLVMPGFNDSHTHLLMAAMSIRSVNFEGAKSEEEAVQMLRNFYAGCERKKDEWLLGFNWYHIFWDNGKLPTKASLDKYFKDVPVFLLNSEAHGAWVNSKALEIAGIDSGTPDPAGGEILRDEKGEPTGVLSESALGLAAKYAYDFDDATEMEFVSAYMKEANEYGITSVVDVRPFFCGDIGSPELYSKMDKAGTMTVRIHTAGDLLGGIEKAREDSEKYNSEKLKANFLKQFIDGVIVTHTAYMLDDYADMPGNKGEPACDTKRIKEAVMEAHRRGISVKLHAVGDAAVRFCLDAYEVAKATYGETGARHAIEHIEIMSQEDFDRFKDIGVIPSMQPEHLGLSPKWEDEPYIKTLGDKKGNMVWPAKTLLDRSGVIAIGSDFPVVNNNPFFEISRAVYRIHDDGLPEGGWNPKEKLTMSEVLKGYTYGSAYGVGREKELGTLEAGKFADLVVLDRNIFGASYDEIRNAKVDMTIMDGNVVYERK